MEETMSSGKGDFRNVIGIDGPAASGKSTMAHLVADKLGATFLDTGALYRTVSLAALQKGVPLDDGPALAELAKSLPIRIADNGDVFLGTTNVSAQLLETEITDIVSQVAMHSEVRDALLPLQRRIASSGDPVVIVGRDIGSVVTPDAGVLIFLTASDQERARRRFEQELATGSDRTFEEVLVDLRRRDHADSTRPVAPLKRTDRATVLETDGLAIDQVVERIVTLVHESWREAQL